MLTQVIGKKNIQTNLVGKQNEMIGKQETNTRFFSELFFVDTSIKQTNKQT
jgi:hypothetical protein